MTRASSKDYVILSIHVSTINTSFGVFFPNKHTLSQQERLFVAQYSKSAGPLRIKELMDSSIDIHYYWNVSADLSPNHHSSNMNYVAPEPSLRQNSAIDVSFLLFLNSPLDGYFYPHGTINSPPSFEFSPSRLSN